MNAPIPALTLAVLLTSASGLHAEETADELAREAFDQGVVYFKAEQYQEAARSFRKAYELKPTWKLLFNIAQCEAALKRYGLAFESFESYLLEGGDEVTAARQEAIRVELSRLRDLSGELDIQGPDGARVHVDGIERGTLPLVGTLRVAGGRHRITVIQDGKTIDERDIKLSGRGVVAISVAEPSSRPEQGEPAESTATASLEKKPRKPLRLWGWITAGTGAATAIAGGITGGVALSKTGDLEDRCKDNICTDKSDMDLKGEAENLGLATDILIPVGGTLVAAGILMILLDSKEEKNTAGLRMTPILGSHTSGFAIEGRF